MKGKFFEEKYSPFLLLMILKAGCGDEGAGSDEVLENQVTEEAENEEPVSSADSQAAGKALEEITFTALTSENTAKVIWLSDTDEGE